MNRIKNKMVGVVITLSCFLSSFHLMSQEVELAPKLNKDKWGYVNSEGKKIIAFKYQKAKEFSEGLAAVQAKNGKWGYIDKKGNVVIPLIYGRIYDDNAAKFHNGIALITTGSKYFFIDKTGQTVSSLYDYVDTFSAEGLAKVRTNNKQGLVDRSGKPVTPLYDKIGNFSEGLARVELNKKIGYIDTTGKEVIPCKYDNLGNFFLNSEGLAVFERDGKDGFIDKKGIESDMKSSRPELPVTFPGVREEICIIDVKAGKKNGNTLITLYGKGLNTIPLSFDGSADYSKMVNVTITAQDGKEYEATTLETGLLSFSVYFNTPEDPRFVYLFMGNDPDNKIQIDFK